jgi:hypothetical protein
MNGMTKLGFFRRELSRLSKLLLGEQITAQSTSCKSYPSESQCFSINSSHGTTVHIKRLNVVHDYT